MSTDQTTPPPASVTLPGTASDGEPAGGLDRADGIPQTGEVQQAGEVQRPDGLGQPDESVPDEPGAPVQPSAAAPAPAGDLVPMSFPGARRIAGWLFWVVFPLLCIAAVHTSVTSAIHHLGNKPVGIRGTFVVQPRSCSQGFCSFGGLFTSDDHTIKNLPLLGDPRWHTAEVHQVTYDPRSVEVTALPGHWNPTPAVMATIGALTYLGTIGYFFRQRRRSTAEQRAGREPVPTG